MTGPTPPSANRWDTISDQYDNRREALTNRARLDTPYKPAPPGLLYLDETAWAAALAPRRRLHLTPWPSPRDRVCWMPKAAPGAASRQSDSRNL
jgi:hypothetical protein